MFMQYGSPRKDQSFWTGTASEQSLQEKAFKAYVDLETEELTNFCREIGSLPAGREGVAKALMLLKEYAGKRVDVLNEAHALFLAVEAARNKK